MSEIKPAVLLTLWFIIFFGLLFPLVLWTGGQLLFPSQANGSFADDASGKPVGSRLIGQLFTSAKYFHGRPSAAGSGYDATSSGGTNLGPTSKKLIEGEKDDPSTPNADESFAGIDELATAYRNENGLSAGTAIPADAVTRSASGLDPEISPENARLQTARVANARNISVAALSALVSEHTQGRFLGIFGEPRVNVLELNLALDARGRS